MQKLALTLCVALLWSGSIAEAPAQSPEGFYKGRNIDLYIGYSVGGGYDVYARTIARHLGKHLPGNPNIVPRNMEGAGSLRLANWIANAAPRDGTAIGAVSRSVAFDPLFDTAGAAFRGDRLSWIGSANDEVSVCVSTRESGVRTIEDAKKRPVPVGSSGINDDTGQFPRVINALLGTKFKVVTGYPGGNDTILALERGEVEARCGWSWSSVLATHKPVIDSGRFIVLIQTAPHRHSDLPDIPSIADFAKTEEQKQIVTLFFARQTMGRPFVAPPGIPQDRLDMLRTAFLDTIKDPELLQDADAQRLEINPVSGSDVQRLVQETYATSPNVIAKAAEMIR
jgi:tripartite-type tricarboxylate transporter receptor subunit TctC